MAIKDFKKIEGNKGYLVNDKDRQIFESEISKGYFGMNIGDTIEFILYDSNDNLLPQESAGGKKVRYIEYNETNSQKYFGKTQNNKDTKVSNDSEEFFIDIQKLIKDAGYSNGIFKSQVSLLNRRLGSADNQYDKVWIHEISPSRTEIRVLEMVDETGKVSNDLSERYGLFVDGKTFYPDVYPFIDNFIQQFNSQRALEVLLTLKGKVSEGQNYIKLIEEEFKVPNIETFLKRIEDKFIEAATHFKNGRIYDITSNRYGQPNGIRQSLNGDIDNIYNIMLSIVTQCIEYYLPKRDIRIETSLTLEQQQTLDELQKLQKTETSDGLYKTTIPESVSAPTIGCKNPDALNYNPSADIHDEGLCEFVSEIQVCNDPAASNYGQVGVCTYPSPPPPLPDPTPIKVKEVPRPNTTELIQERIEQQREAEKLIGIDPLGGQEDLDPALVKTVMETYNEVNKKTFEVRRELEEEAKLEPEPVNLGGAGVTSVSANQYDRLSASEKLILAKKPAVVLDGRIKDRTIKEI
jgi:hypothetical protein